MLIPQQCIQSGYAFRGVVPSQLRLPALYIYLISMLSPSQVDVWKGVHRRVPTALWAPDDHGRSGSRWFPHQGATDQLPPPLLALSLKD